MSCPVPGQRTVASAPNGWRDWCRETRRGRRMRRQGNTRQRALTAFRCGVRTARLAEPDRPAKLIRTPARPADAVPGAADSPVPHRPSTRRPELRCAGGFVVCRVELRREGRDGDSGGGGQVFGPRHEDVAVLEQVARAERGRDGVARISGGLPATGQLLYGGAESSCRCVEPVLAAAIARPLIAWELGREF